MEGPPYRARTRRSKEVREEGEWLMPTSPATAQVSPIKLLLELHKTARASRGQVRVGPAHNNTGQQEMTIVIRDISV